ncbi:MAG: KAP family NTPase, partial [Flavobacteriales bacterium]|nr:KAP family NTPase [Flavobacteriales bacterium]
MSIILKTPDKTNQLLTRKNVLLILGCLTVFILFKKSVESLLSNTVVNYLFNQVESIWYNDIIFFLITFIPIFFIFYRYRNYTPSNHITILILITSIIYLFYRIEGATWEFTPFSLYFKIKYADTLLIISICQLLLYIPRKKITPNIENNSFFDDNSLGKIGNDELGYSSYAELLGEKILSSHFEKSFAIGINGKWGAGKTSFIDLLKRKVQNDNIIEINFNPWNNHSPKAIIKDFFETVQESIRPYHSSLSRLFIQYSNKLVDLNSNTVTQSIQTTVSAISGFDSLNSLYQDINTALVSIDKKIIVYIDDLDRLDKHEIIEVIRLIRNTANFYNTFFIVAYDRNYVVNALKQHNPYKQEEFLEKIFQIEITLPFYKKDILRYKLAEKLKTKLPEIDFTTIDNAVIGTPSSIPVFLNEWLESMRDVTRLANAILLNLNKIKGEVVFNDLLRIELLRLKYPSSYELLSKRETE